MRAPRHSTGLRRPLVIFKQLRVVPRGHWHAAAAAPADEHVKAFVGEPEPMSQITCSEQINMCRWDRHRAWKCVRMTLFGLGMLRLIIKCASNV
jgi:hypothetical protein